MTEQQVAALTRSPDHNTSFGCKMSSLRLLMFGRSLTPSQLTIRPAMMNATARHLRTVKHQDRAAASHTKTELIRDDLKYDPEELGSFFDKVNEEISTKLHRKRLFAIVYLYGSQHLFTEGDYIMVRKYFPAEAGARVKLERCMLVGSDNLTLVGRPVLDRDLVHVEATVVEKTLSQTHTNCIHVQRRSGYRRWRFNRNPLTFLRINEIRICHKINESQQEVQ